MCHLKEVSSLPKEYIKAGTEQVLTHILKPQLLVYKKLMNTTGTWWEI